MNKTNHKLTEDKKMISSEEHRNEYDTERLRLELNNYANKYNNDELDYDDIINRMYDSGYDMDIIEEVESELRELIK